MKKEEKCTFDEKGEKIMNKKEIECGSVDIDYGLNSKGEIKVRTIEYRCEDCEYCNTVPQKTEKQRVVEIKKVIEGFGYRFE